MSVATATIIPFSCATARAGTDYERQACALMDDYSTSMHLGTEPASYALSVLSTEMPRIEADRVLSAGIKDYCPNHAGDLPPGW